MEWEKQYDLNTPELVPVKYEVVGLGSRFVGYALDMIIIYTVVMLVVLFAMLVLSGMDVVLDYDLQNMALSTATKAVAAILFLFFFVFYWGYHVFFETTRLGRTPGKRYAGIQVVKADGTPITFRDSMIRNLIRIVDMLPTMYIVGGVVMLRNPEGQRLGDKLAGTLVIRNRGISYLDNPGDDQPLVIQTQAAPDLAARDATKQITEREYEIIISFLKRRETLDSYKRVEIARRIAHQLAWKYQLEGYNPNFPEHFLESLVNGG